MRTEFTPTYDIGEEYVPPPGGYYPEKPNWNCTCSCGKQSSVTFNARRGCYVAKEKGWQYDPKKGWTCGEPDHTRGPNMVTSGVHTGYIASISPGGLIVEEDEGE